MKKILLLAGIISILAACSKESYRADEKHLSFKVMDSITPLTPGEKAMIDIKASDGKLPYTYYVIPETQWIAGEAVRDMLMINDFSLLYRYEHVLPLIEVAPGTATNPKYYWVAVQDDTNEAPLGGTNLLSWWKRIAVYGL